MKETISALVAAVVLGSSLFLGAGAAQAFSCPAGQHVISMGGVSDCVPNASGGGTGGAINYDGGGKPNAPAPAPIQVPVYNAPVWTPPAYTPPPVYNAPQAPAPVSAPNAPAVPQAPLSVGGGYSGGNSGYTAPVANQAPVYTAPGGVAVAKNSQGVWVDPSTGMAADAGVAAQAEQAAAAAPPQGDAVPAAAAAVALPATEVQAVEVLRSATATPAEKDAALAIVKTKINAVLDKAIVKTLGSH